ncbi:hypothetical protein Tco_0725574 [Tanacetum coccineum]|uniref:Uncharacterized protein n=1 Tax=Tanacetum coccineum TaxID=301880 RepID=A0ABQ4YFF2_9ASTR
MGTFSGHGKAENQRESKEEGKTKGRYFECMQLKDADDPIKTKVDDWEFKGLFGVLLVDNVEEQRWDVK